MSAAQVANCHAWSAHIGGGPRGGRREIGARVLQHVRREWMDCGNGSNARAGVKDDGSEMVESGFDTEYIEEQGSLHVT